MNRFILGITAAVVFFTGVELAGAVECHVTARFSSEGSIGGTVAQAIRETKSRLTLAIYGFDNAELAEELIKLAKKNLSVRVKIDANRSASKKINVLVERMRAAGVQIQTVAADGRNHNKFAVIDGSKVLTGSYNWTLKAEKNWENLLLLDCPDLAQSYEREWEKVH